MITERPQASPPAVSTVSSRPAPRRYHGGFALVNPFAAVPVQQPEGLGKIGFYAFCFLLFALFSRAFDLYFARFHLPLISEIIALLAAFLTGGFMRISKTRTGLALMGLTFWLVATVPMAYWRGGTIGLVSGWLKQMTSFIMAAALIVTVRQCRKALFTLGFAGAVGGGLLYFKGIMIQGRLSLDRGRFNNANDAAMLLLLCLPCLCLIVMDAGRNKLIRMAAAGSLAITMLAIAKTGSRAGFIGFLVLCVIVFLQASPAAKAKLLLLAMLLTVAFFTVIPHEFRARYTTFFNAGEAASQEEAQLLSSATGSSEDRWNQLINSLKLTIKKPIFGVGPGNFSIYYAQTADGNWNGTHNTYTQYSSETGIPGLTLYLMVLTYSIKDLGKIIRRARKLPGPDARNLAQLAFTLRSSFVAFCVCSFFEHIGYEMIVPIMAGLAAAVITAGELELPFLESRNQAGPAVQIISPPQPLHRRATPAGTPVQ
jgi:O-antigen ligase